MCVCEDGVGVGICFFLGLVMFLFGGLNVMESVDYLSWWVGFVKVYMYDVYVRVIVVEC